MRFALCVLEHGRWETIMGENGSPTPLSKSGDNVGRPPLFEFSGGKVDCQFFVGTNKCPLLNKPL